MSNIVYIATSLNGYIADKDGNLDWLHRIPNPEQSDFGWSEFMSGIDGLVMGRTTFETVLGFDCDWPYTKPVFVLSNTMKEIPDSHKDKASLVSGALSEIRKHLNEQGFKNLYIGGGKTVQSFLSEDLIDELIITQIPVLLGGGAKLFGDLEYRQQFELVKSEVLINAMVKSHFKRVR
ncbi:dihydrofolate reductase family protein [Grimontia sp. NTOU-MAR1]|uniref:dihydrofolate reductase family protein n=1 Tax=Grimontia sp. NTOU-MAR1 TaxID=3111011 RepID=UPI002DC0115C|nr:dihydrofolate reductase family protein [Grimontia sp. NTOU-MAR1]WRV98311.1 dihydrofolate reductase family protein [Grimontia sp. NTOU-MAR1]